MKNQRSSLSEFLPDLESGPKAEGGGSGSGLSAKMGIFAPFEQVDFRDDQRSSLDQALRKLAVQVEAATREAVVPPVGPAASLMTGPEEEWWKGFGVGVWSGLGIAAGLFVLVLQ